MIGGISLAAAAIAFSGCASPGMGASPSSSSSAVSSEDSSISQEARAALKDLNSKNQAAAILAEEAKGVLVFPSVKKAGFMVGGFLGDGVLLKDGEVDGYYRTSGASYGFQAGIQKYGYALFFMSDRALKYVDETQGWEIGVGPSVVVVDEGMGKSLTTTTGREDVYAFIFDQKGLMAGMGLQGSMISGVQ